MLPRYHLYSLDIADQCALHPDQHQGFAVTGCPCRSTLSAWILFIRRTDFFGSCSGRHSKRGVCGGSQPAAAPSLSAPLHLLLPERVVSINNVCRLYLFWEGESTKGSCLLPIGYKARVYRWNIIISNDVLSKEKIS